MIGPNPVEALGGVGLSGFHDLLAYLFFSIDGYGH